MQKLVFAIAALTLTIVPYAHSQTPAIMGHTLGESVQDFVNKSPRLSNTVAGCRVVSDKKTAKKQKLDWELCQQLLTLVNGNGSGDIGANSCGPEQQLKDITVPECREFHGVAQFIDGKLASLTTKLMAPWDQVYQDLTVKFGEPIDKGQKTFQNGYGATFHTSKATWLSPEYSVVATESLMFNRVDIRQVTVYLGTPEAIRRAKSEVGQPKSTLD